MSKHITELDQNVKRKKVNFKNRYGFKVVGELYHSKDCDLTTTRPALIVRALLW